MSLLTSALSLLGQIHDASKPEYPSDHKAGMKVPIGGSMCANCEYLSADQKHCTNSYFIKWRGPDKPAGSDVIPGEIDAYCSDWFEPKE
jgi:hypothetical protein